MCMYRIVSYPPTPAQTEVMPMSKVNEAMQKVREGKPRYRIVMTPDFE